MIAYVYLQKSLLSPPNVERHFDSSGTNDQVQEKLNALGKTGKGNGTLPPFVTGALNASCDLSLMLHDVMSWNAQSVNIEEHEDLDKRRQLYDGVQSWRDGLPTHLRYEANFTPQTCFLRYARLKLVLRRE